MIDEPDKQISLPIVGKPGHRQWMYGKIALEHGKLEHVKRLLGNGQVQLSPLPLLLHVEASVAFLAEELLRLKVKMGEMKSNVEKAHVE